MGIIFNCGFHGGDKNLLKSTVIFVWCYASCLFTVCYNRMGQIGVYVRVNGVSLGVFFVDDA